MRYFVVSLSWKYLKRILGAAHRTGIMVLDPRSRQKKVERRKAKEKSKHEALKVRGQQLVAQATQAVSSAPILHCCAIDVIWERGIGHVVFSRLLPNRQVAVSSFLLDMYCLGVKNAMFGITDRAQYDKQVYGKIRDTYDLETLDPACARKLVEGGVEYARKLGFPPHPDYIKAKAIFGDIDPATCERTFEYGKDGKPLFVAGPYETQAQCSQIMRTLTASCGVGGFDFVMGAGGSAMQIEE